MEPESIRDAIRNTPNIARFFTEQRQVAWVCLAIAILWGLYGLFGMPQRKDPDVPVRVALIVVPWPGTKPEQVEQLVTKKVEQAVAQNQWATEIKSVSRTGVATVQFELAEKGDYDAGKELDDIKLRLDSIHDLPQGAGPIIYIKDFGDTSALMLTVASPPADANEVTWRSKLVEERVRRLRSGLKGKEDTRVSVVVAYPGSIDRAEVERPVLRISQVLASRGVISDFRVFGGAGFAGVDFSTALSDSDLLASINRLVEDELQTDEFHPDAWKPALIRDPAKTLSVMQSVAGDKYTYRDLDDFTETIQRSLKTVPLSRKWSAPACFRKM